MKKYIIAAVVVSGLLLGGCTGAGSTKSTYNVTLGTMAENETVDMNAVIDLTKQVGSMYNIGRIAGCRVLAAKGCDDGSIMIATPVNNDSENTTTISFRRIVPWDTDNIEVVAEQDINYCNFPYVEIISTEPLMYEISSENESSVQLTAVSDNALYSTPTGSNTVQRTDNYVIVSGMGDGTISYYDLNDTNQNGIPKEHIVDVYGKITEYNPDVTALDYVGIYAVDPKKDRIYITTNYTVAYGMSLTDLVIDSDFMISDNENLYFRDDYYLKIDMNNDYMLHKYSTTDGAYMEVHEINPGCHVTDSHYAAWAFGGSAKTVVCLDTDDMTEYTSYDLVSNSWVYDITYVPHTDALILEMSDDLYVLWDVFDKYPDV